LSLDPFGDAGALLAEAHQRNGNTKPTGRNQRGISEQMCGQEGRNRYGIISAVSASKCAGRKEETGTA
jgi:hypothetical protein